ncbi:hypothetical protein NE865_15031 [Phthorimaea operculella]|nr:hypothetical protein NE865_15031 [Phthorimaea operculella]
MADLPSLVAARGQAKGTMTRILNYCKGEQYKVDAFPVLVTKRQRLMDSFKEYCSLNVSVTVLQPDDTEDFAAIEERYMEAMALLEARLSGSPGGKPEHTAPPPQHQRLPPIAMSKFDGKTNGQQRWRLSPRAARRRSMEEAAR